MRKVVPVVPYRRVRFGRVELVCGHWRSTRGPRR